MLENNTQPETEKKNLEPLHETLGKNRLKAVIVPHSSDIYSVGEPIMKNKLTLPLNTPTYTPAVRQRFGVLGCQLQSHRILYLF